MVSESSLTDKPPPVASFKRASDKVRIRFRKCGDLRFVSHRDLMKCFERILRRAQLPIYQTHGFHPLPRMVFALSLSLGIIGLDEVLELEFSESIDPDDVRQRLAEQMPPGLEVLSVARIPINRSAQVRRAGYRVSVAPDQLADLSPRIDALLASPECWIERTRPAPRRLNLRPFISELRVNEGRLEMLLWVTPNGAARPGEVLGLLGLADLAQSGVPMERHILELHDELEG